mmetsp:Transcript_5153/g.21969  ORF Transcript_5153/g.21969 Transcript_5153/m.21969 type:complete len:281 (+) Transcript_5153:946-1788(+)
MPSSRNAAGTRPSGASPSRTMRLAEHRCKHGPERLVGRERDGRGGNHPQQVGAVAPVEPDGPLAPECVHGTVNNAPELGAADLDPALDHLVRVRNGGGEHLGRSADRKVPERRQPGWHLDAPELLVHRELHCAVGGEEQCWANAPVQAGPALLPDDAAERINHAAVRGGRPRRVGCQLELQPGLHKPHGVGEHDGGAARGHRARHVGRRPQLRGISVCRRCSPHAGLGLEPLVKEKVQPPREPGASHAGHDTLVKAPQTFFFENQPGGMDDALVPLVVAP